MADKASDTALSIENAAVFKLGHCTAHGDSAKAVLFNQRILCADRLIIGERTSCDLSENIIYNNLIKRGFLSAVVSI